MLLSISIILYFTPVKPENDARTMESCLPSFKDQVFYKNSSLVFKSRDVQLNLLSHISQWNLVCSFIQIYDFYKNSSLFVKSRCENLFSHISQWNPVNSFIQSYEYLIRIQDLFSNLDSTRCKIESFFTKLFCPFKSRCKLECFVTYLKM